MGAPERVGGRSSSAVHCSIFTVQSHQRSTNAPDVKSKITHVGMQAASAVARQCSDRRPLALGWGRAANGGKTKGDQLDQENGGRRGRPADRTDGPAPR